MPARARVTILFLAAVLISLYGCGHANAPAETASAGPVVSLLAFPDGAGRITLPLVEDSGLLLTDAVSINGRGAGWFVIDTGAAITVVDAEAASRIGLRPAARPARADNTRATVKPCPVDSLGVGGMVLSNHLVAVGDLSSVSKVTRRRVAGALGGDVWGRSPFTIDYWTNRLVIYDRPDFRPPAGLASHRLAVLRARAKGPFADANPSLGQPVVGGVVDGLRTPVVLDTGFDGTLLLMPRFAAAHPKFLAPGESVVARAHGVAGAMAGRTMARAAADHVDAMGARMRCDGTALVLLGKDEDGENFGAIVGSNFLSHGRLTFDYAAGRVWAEWRRLSDGGSRASKTGR